MKIMKKINGIIGLLILVLMFSACRKDIIIEDKIDNPGNPGVSQETSVFGIVYDKNELPLANVQVTIDEMNAVSDEQGVFMVRKAKIESIGTMVKIEKNGYFDVFRTIYPPQPSDKLYVTVKMVPKGEPVKFQSIDGGNMNLPNGGGIQFSNNSISYEYNGSSYDGEVLMYAHYYDPADATLGMTAPASLEAIDKNGDEKGLYTYGMYAIELETEFGQKLNLKDGTEAEMRFPVPPSLSDEAPATIPLWFVDEETGLWNEEGSAQRAGDEYVGMVSHFSFWNCDVPYDLIEIEGTITTAGGTPLANYPVFIRRNNFWGAYGYTNNVGFFHGKVPANEILDLEINHCGVSLVDQEIGPYNVDVDLGNFEVTLTDFATTISGTMKSCMGEPISDGYGIIYHYSIVIPDLNGMFSTVVTGCGNTELTAQFFDGMNLSVSEVLPIDKDAATNALGDIAVCTDLGEYISFSVDGGTYRIITDPEIAKIDGERIVLRGNTEGYEFSGNFEVPLVGVGSANPTKTNLYSRLDGGDFGNGGGFNCEEDLNNELIYSCDDFLVTISDYDEVNEIITGTFAGVLASQDSADYGGSVGDLYDVVGSFRAPITKEFNAASINGKMWVDLNGNGTRDTDEEDITLPISSVSLTKEGSSFEFGDSWTTFTDGNYSLEGLEPGTYIVRIYGYPYEVTATDVGDDTKDNDFALGMNGNQFETTLTIEDGENVMNVDIGIKAPDEVFCFVNGGGCAPDVYLNISINGGLPPYTASLDGATPVVVENNSTIFYVPTGGTYEVEVVDALGNISNCSSNVFSFATSVSGRVWTDLPENNDGIYDSGEEQLKDVIVNLYKSDGTFYKSDVTVQWGYNIRDIEYGEYYIEPVVPSGLELTIKSDENNGSDIDPSTGRSDIFVYDECFTNQSIFIGLKEQ